MIYRSFKSIIPFLTKIVFSIYWLLYANLRVLLCTNFTSTISIQESKFLVQTTGCFFFFGFSQGAVNKLFYGVLGSFCTFCIVKYGRTFILVHLINRNKKKVENFHLLKKEDFQGWLKLDHFQPHFFGGCQL